MSSEFNPVRVRDKYADFNGKIKEQMQLLLADGRYPMFTRELAEQRVQGRGIGRYVDTGDLVTYNGKGDNQEIRFILTANRQGLTEVGRFALGLINPYSDYMNGALDLTKAKDAPGKDVNGAYDAISGSGVIVVKRKEIIGARMTQEQVLNHKGWRILLRHPDEVPAEFAEDFEGAKEYIGKVVFSRYDPAMGMFLSDGEKVPTLRAWCVYGLGGSDGSDAIGRYRLVDDGGCSVGVAPGAPNALGNVEQRVASPERRILTVDEVLEETSQTSAYAPDQIKKLQNILDQRGYVISVK